MIGTRSKPAIAAHWLALAVVCVALLQATFGAAANGISSDVSRDIFGNPLCLSQGNNHTRGGADHSQTPACCSAGCLVTSLGSALLPDTLWALPNRTASVVAHRAWRAPALRKASHHAYHPRGPPLVV